MSYKVAGIKFHEPQNRDKVWDGSRGLTDDLQPNGFIFKVWRNYEDKGDSEVWVHYYDDSKDVGKFTFDDLQGLYVNETFGYIIGDPLAYQQARLSYLRNKREGNGYEDGTRWYVWDSRPTQIERDRGRKVASE